MMIEESTYRDTIRQRESNESRRNRLITEECRESHICVDPRSLEKGVIKMNTYWR